MAEKIIKNPLLAIVYDEKEDKLFYHLEVRPSDTLDAIGHLLANSVRFAADCCKVSEAEMYESIERARRVPSSLSKLQ